MELKCIFDGTPMEIWSEPSLSGEAPTFARCPKCGFEIGGADIPLSSEEVKACLDLRRQIKNRGGAIIG